MTYGIMCLKGRIMPQVQFVYQTKGIRETKGMPTPPRHTDDPHQWYKMARRVIPTIPDTNSTDWYVNHISVTTEWITFEMLDTVGNRSAIVIDRMFDTVSQTRKPTAA